MTSRQGAARRLGMAVSDPPTLAIRSRAEPARRRGASRPRSRVLLRWLLVDGPDLAAVAKRAESARAACPPGAGRFQGLLAVLAGDLEGAASLLPVRPGSAGRGTIIQGTSCFRCCRGRSGASLPGRCARRSPGRCIARRVSPVTSGRDSVDRSADLRERTRRFPAFRAALDDSLAGVKA